MRHVSDNRETVTKLEMDIPIIMKTYSTNTVYRLHPDQVSHIQCKAANIGSNSEEMEYSCAACNKDGFYLDELSTHVLLKCLSSNKYMATYLQCSLNSSVGVEKKLETNHTSTLCIALPPLVQVNVPQMEAAATERQTETRAQTDVSLIPSDNLNEEISRGVVDFDKSRKEKCFLCNKKYENHVIRKTHLLMHAKHGPYNCNLCAKVYNRRKHFWNHLRVGHEVSVEADSIATWKTNCNERSKQSLPSICSFCGKTYKSMTYLKQHERIVHNNEPKIHKCSICHMEFHFAFMLQAHIDQHKGISKCFCHVCGRGFVRLKNLRMHMVMHSSSRPHNCKICGAAFKRTRNLKAHMLSHMGLRQQSGTRKRQIARCTVIHDVTFCDICNKEFVLKQQLLVHMKVHDIGGKEFTFSCTQCKRRFTCSRHLENHIKNEHATDTTYICDNCDGQFTSKWKLRMHMMGTDSELSTYSCTQCKQSFTTKHMMQYHVNCVHDRPKLVVPRSASSNFYCRICVECFNTQSALQEHKKINHPKSANKAMFQCETCDKLFTTKYGRDSHVTIHTGVKSFFCEKCPKVFRTALSLSTHNQTHSSVKRFGCTVCEKRFHRSCQLTTHMRIHTGEKPYSCDICSRAFAQCGDMRKHRVSVHKVKDSRTKSTKILKSS